MTIEISFVTEVPDLAEFQALLLDYYESVLPIAASVGLTGLDPKAFAQSSIDHLDEMLPPDGRLALAQDGEGRLVGCATLRRIRPDAVEMKRMFVRPVARRQGVARRLFEIRIAEAHRMGCTKVYADTVRGNRPMLDMYEGFGFRYVPRYDENANPAEFAPYLVYLECDLRGVTQGDADA